MSSPAGVDVLCIGETMAVIASEDDRPLSTGSALSLHVGGAESNVAAALAAAGHTVAWASRLGDDPLGDVVLAQLYGAGVDVTLVERTPQPTGLYVKSPSPRGTRPLYYRRGSAASTMDAPFVRSLAQQARPRVVHVSGITGQISDSGIALLREICQNRVFGEAVVSFDVNHRPALASSDTPAILREFARSADICFVGADEAQRLWGIDAAGIETYLRGPRHLIVKDADVDAVELVDGATHRAPATRVDVVEATGAGDAFAAGWLSMYLRGGDAVSRLENGHRHAAHALSSRGDSSPLPTP